MIHTNSYLRAIGFALASFTSWVVADVLMKLAGEAHLPPYEIVAFLGITSVLFILIMVMYSKESIKSLWPNCLWKQSVRALLVFGQNIFLVIALNHLPLVPFYVIVFVAPLIVALLAKIFLHEKLGFVSAVAIMAGFSGVLLAINPFQQDVQGSWIGYLAALANTTCFAVNTVWLRVMTQSESTNSLAFIEALCSTLLCGLFMLFQPLKAIDPNTLLILIGMAFFALAGNIWQYKALNLTKAATVMQFHYTQIISGALFGYLIWHEVPTWACVAGSFVIIGSGMAVAAHTHKAAKIESV
ncbi:MAG: DMT family transporter [Pseudomonadota bacterium]